jgi:hypothetical protein
MIAEKLLWRAVLNQAVIDFASPGYIYGVDAASMQKSAAEWFLSPSRSLGSFLFICDILDINPEWFRKQLFGTSSDVLKNRVATQHRSRDKLASIAVSEETVADEIAGC